MTFEEPIKTSEFLDGEQRMVKKIEHSPFSDQEKIDILLALSDLKPVSVLQDISSYQTILPKIQENLQRMGLFVLYRKNQFKYIVLSRDPLKAEHVAELFGTQKEITREREEELGILLGYPLSAARAHAPNAIARWRGEKILKDPQIPYQELPQQIRDQDFMAFCRFSLSRAHWRDEIKTAQKWAEEIRRLSPDLYARVVQRYQRERKQQRLGY